MEQEKIRVLIANSTRIWRDMLYDTIREESDIEVVGDVSEENAIVPATERRLVGARSSDFGTQPDDSHKLFPSPITENLFPVRVFCHLQLFDECIESGIRCSQICTGNDVQIATDGSQSLVETEQACYWAIVQCVLDPLTAGADICS